MGDVQITICGPDTIIEKGIWCRPLYFLDGDFGSSEYTQSGTYGGVINNYKWLPIEDFLGPYWFGKTIKDFLDGTDRLTEFAKGDIPADHCISKAQLQEKERR